MGVKAAVVYDVSRHRTVILRTQSVSPTERYEVLDTIASFSSHCESLKGLARSVTEVSALWGGPPYVNYNVVNNRFRVIIIWDEGNADLGVTHDVYRALSRLEKVVNTVADALVDRFVGAVSRVYDEAGYALRGDYPSDLVEDSQSQKPRSKILSIPSSTRRSSVAEPKRKNSSSLFGRIGSAIKGTKGDKLEERHRNTPRSTSLREPSEETALSVAAFESETGFDDEEGDVEFANEVFAWADFGGPLPDDMGNLDWFEALLKGETSAKERPRVPVLRPGRNPKTPLKIPSVVELQQEQDIVDAHEAGSSKQISDRLASAPGTPPVASPPTAPGVSSQTSTTGTPAIRTPAKTATPVPLGTPIASSTTSAQTLIPQSRNSMVNSSMVTAPGSLPHSGLSVPQSFGPVAQSPPVAPPAYSSNSSQAAVHASPLIVNSLPPRAGVGPGGIHQGIITPQSDVVLGTQQSSTAGSTPQIQAPAPSPASNIPAGLLQSDNFDVAGLGGLKDVGTSSRATHRTDEEEVVREKMNEFATTMQSGNFRVSLQQVIATLRYLAGVNPRRDREITTCANYYLAQKILIKNSGLEQELSGIPGGTAVAVQRHVECALLTMFLAELKHLTPRHRIAAMKVAVEKNSIVGNYGMCARWLRHLVEKAPAGKKADFANRLQICVRNGERNSNMPPTNRLCYNSLQVVGSPYGACAVCPAVFHPLVGGVTAGQVCTVCYLGVIEHKMQ